MILTDRKEQKLNTIQQSIIEIISRSPIMFVGRNYVLLDYSSCGNDIQMIASLELMEKMLEKHFTVIRRTAYLGQRDITLSIDIA